MSAIQAKLDALLDAVLALLQGSPVRVIGYGGAVIIYLVANAAGRIPDVSFATAVTDATAAIALLVTIVEGIRHFAWSPSSVGDLQATIDALQLQLKLNSIAPESVTPAPDDPLPNEVPAPADPAADPDETGTGDS